ncbi:MAG TPA: nuclear transport factor 2 family protein [Sphingomicrobium sp.]|nr:nuclear transport factor 2 family protein [Sphingomicrobium sp.]
MQRDEMVAKVEAAYAARRSGDFAALEPIVAKDAVFVLAGDESIVSALPGSGEGTNVHHAARRLFDTLELRELERVKAVAEGNEVAIIWKTTAAVPGSEPFDTLMFDLWEFDDQGRICRGTQFVDTAKFAQAMRARAEV